MQELNDHPSPIDVSNQLRMIIPGKSPGIVQNELSTINAAAGSEEFIVSSVLKSAGIVADFDGQHDTEGDSDGQHDTEGDTDGQHDTEGD
ncbi:hypothetical protein PR048_020702 [Dryococelus australis]|uniref:Uncharacterized protein n=1 Tax=Dryococelus australis TaxID=614101 RepID=A0ABQ9H730_9NEOP|nr:hypothetical protein PR048_020702 [Dryococelus australis]